MLMLVTRPDARVREIVAAAVAGGVNLVQVRGGVDAKAIRDAVRNRARVVVNGLTHFPETAPFVKGDFTGRSVHSVDAAVRAEAEGCHYVLAGSVFPTPSHPDGPAGGLQLLRDIASAVRIPVLAIGGIAAANARSCIDAGAQGVAVISAIFDAPDPRAAAQELWRAIS